MKKYSVNNVFQEASYLANVNNNRDAYELINENLEIVMSNYITSDRFDGDYDEMFIQAIKQKRMMPNVGIDSYDAIMEQIKLASADYYNEDNIPNNLGVMDHFIRLNNNSLIMYSMLCALFRSQCEAYTTDAKERFLAPVLLNHRDQSINNWGGQASNYANVYSTSQTNDIGDVNNGSPSSSFSSRENKQSWGTFKIGQEDWKDIVTNILSAIYLTPGQREFAEHFFTKHFVDTKAHNLHIYTFWPTSMINTATTAEMDDSNIELGGYTNIDGVFSANESEASGARCFSGTDLDEFKNYIDEYRSYTTRIFNRFPQLKKILVNIGCANGSTFDFTRPMAKANMRIAVWGDVADFVRSTTIANRILPDPNPNEQIPYVYQYADNLAVNDPDNCYADLNTKYIIKDVDTSKVLTGANLSWEYYDNIDADYAALVRGWIAPLSITGILEQLDHDNVVDSYYFVCPPYFMVNRSGSGSISKFADYNNLYYNTESSNSRFTLNTLGIDGCHVDYSKIVNADLDTYYIPQTTAALMQDDAADHLFLHSGAVRTSEWKVRGRREANEDNQA